MQYFQVHAFVGPGRRGNQAGVCLATTPLSDDDMLRIAQDIGHSETCFLTRQSDSAYRIRYFAPGGEVQLCGHATLAAGIVLFAKFGLKDCTLQTNEPTLTLKNEGHSTRMTLPSYSMSQEPIPSFLAPHVSQVEHWFGNGTQVLVLPNQSDVTAFIPPLTDLKDRRVYLAVTSQGADKDTDYVCRFFAPCIGIDEDPVTGSLQCLLAPFWAKRLGKDALRAEQLSARGGLMELATGNGVVHVIGQGEIIVEGELTLPTT